MLQPESTPSGLEGGFRLQATDKQIPLPGVAYWAQVTPPSSPPPPDEAQS
jgi:hypothetical protein